MYFQVCSTDKNQSNIILPLLSFLQNLKNQVTGLQNIRLRYNTDNPPLSLMRKKIAGHMYSIVIHSDRIRKAVQKLLMSLSDVFFPRRW